MTDGLIRHCRAYGVRSNFAVIARSKATKQSTIHAHKAGLLRCARNDEARFTHQNLASECGRGDTGGEIRGLVEDYGTARGAQF